MNNKKGDDMPSIVKISGYENSRKLGKFLSHKGTIPVLVALQEKPKQYRELDAELGLPSTTFETALRDLYTKAHLIRQSPIVADNRETHQYVLNPIGKEIVKSFISYERYISSSKPQQKILEVENNK